MNRVAPSGLLCLKFRNLLILFFALFLFALPVSALPSPPTVIITNPAPSSGGYFSGNLSIDFNVTDANSAHNWIDGNIWLPTLAQGAQSFNNKIATDANLLDGVGQITCTNQANIATSGMTCSYTLNTAIVADANYFIDVNAMDDEGIAGTASTTVSINVDNNAPSTSWDGNHNTWQNFASVISLTCNEKGNGSGCSITKYRLDTNPSVTVSYGSWQTYSSPIVVIPDGNYAIDFNSTDVKGNVGDTNTFYVLIDKTQPVSGVDVRADVNKTGVLSGTPSIDLFVGLDQNLTVRVRNIYSDVNQVSPWVDVNANFSDLNSLNTTWYAMTNSGDGNYFLDYNAGVFDLNFSAKYVTLRIKDTAGNQADMNTATPVLLYSMTIPSGLDGNSTNFQTISNFEAIPNLVFSVAGLGKVAFNQDVNLSTYDQASKIIALQTYFGITASGVEKTVTVDSSAFNDLNKSARITVYDLPTGLTNVRIRKGDLNCGVSCTNVDYNAVSGQLDFNAGSWTSYITDINAPVLSSAAPTTTQTSSNVTLSVNTNEAATCRYGTTDLNYDSMSSAVTSSSSTSHSWSLSGVSNGSYTYYYQCRDSVGFDANTSVSFTVNIQGGGGSSSSETKTSGGTNGTAVVKGPNVEEIVRKQIINIEKGTVNVAVSKPEIAVSQMNIEFTKNIPNAVVTVSLLKERPSEVQELIGATIITPASNKTETIKPKVYQYLEIKKENIVDSDIGKVEISFKVPKSWLKENNVEKDKIVLARYTNNWTDLETIIISENNSEVEFKAKSLGFSYFAVKEKIVLQEAVSEEAEPVKEITPVARKTVQEKQEPVKEEPEKKEEAKPIDLTLVFVLIMLILVGAAVYFYKLKK